MRNTRHLELALLAVVLGGCGPASVPDRPSWDQDVFPILQGSCNHCHGEQVGALGDDGNRRLPTASRYDLCYAQPFQDAMIVPTVGFGAANLAGLIAGPLGIGAVPGKSRPNMPPPPAAPLSDYERDVLLKWAKRAMAVPADACVKQTRNRDPSAAVLSKAEEDGDLVVTLEVSDPDGDQVIGKVSAASAAAQLINAVGRRQYRFAGLDEGASVKVILLDGFSAPVELSF